MEYHTITVDTHGQSSKSEFTVFLHRALRDVVSAKLMAAHVHTDQSTEHLYVSIEELDSRFTDRATSQPDIESNLPHQAFGSIVSTSAAAPSGTTTLFSFKGNDYDIETEFASPIPRLDRLRVRLLNHLGQAIAVGGAGENFLVLRFACKK